MSIPKGSEILSIAKSLYPFNYSVTGKDSLEAKSTFLKFLQFNIHEFKSGQELRGWVLPKGWNVNEAKIFHKKDLIHDCIEKTPLGCAYLSPSFKGTIDKDELLDHCCWREDLPLATVYDWTRLYRRGSKSWGISVPWKELKKFPSKDLRISIDTYEYNSKMIVYDYFLKGEYKEEIIINAHNCHPYQANDDISGCAVGIAIFQYLKTLEKRKYSYRLIISPELFGPMFWLENNKDNVKNILGAILLKSVGNNSSLKIQETFRGDSFIDDVLMISSRDHCKTEYNRYKYRTYYGNDETIFEAPGNKIPSSTLTRFPFNEYHTDLDIIENLSTEKLEETSNILINAIMAIENDNYATSNLEGLYCLSNPKYDLYKKAPEPGISSEGTSSLEKSWNLMMNCLPRLLEEGTSTINLCNKYSLPFENVNQYLKDWQKKGLSELTHNKKFKL